MFARYAKYDDYYTQVSLILNTVAFARYAKYDDYYTLEKYKDFEISLLGMLNMMITIH